MHKWGVGITKNGIFFNILVDTYAAMCESAYAWTCIYTKWKIFSLIPKLEMHSLTRLCLSNTKKILCSLCVQQVIKYAMLSSKQKSCLSGGGLRLDWDGGNRDSCSSESIISCMWLRFKSHKKFIDQETHILLLKKRESGATINVFC